MIWPKEAWFEPIERFRDKLGTMGEGVTVGIWDLGLTSMRDTGKTDAAGKKLYVGVPDIYGGRMRGKSYVDADDSCFDAPVGGMHGAEIARIIGGDLEYWGIAPACGLVAIKGIIADKKYAFGTFALDIPSYKTIDVLNISQAFDPDLRTPENIAIIDEFKQHVSDDKFIVASVGNFSARHGPLITYPSSIESVLSVGATKGWSLEPYLRSAPSKSIDLCAPGVDLNGYYYNKLISGTSFSAAIVSGVACLLAAFRKRQGLVRTAPVLRALMKSAVMPGTDRDRSGEGLLDLEKLFAIAQTTPPTT